MERRNFLKFGVGITALTLAGKANAQLREVPLKNNVKLKEENRLIALNFPIVISTWNFGTIANAEAWLTLRNGGKALDAVENAAICIENDLTNRSVGLGGFPDASGEVTLDACIMNHNGECGSVAYLQKYKNPIKVARAIMEQTPHVMLVGKGAAKFAKSQGMEKGKSPKEVEKEYKKWKKEQNSRIKNELKNPEINHENHDTIGILAIDSGGNFAGACTTSGWAFKLPGRVGDSPLIGSGLFLEEGVGAVCGTGMGEEIIKVNGSHAVLEQMRQGKTPDDACRIVVERIVNRLKKAGKSTENLQCAFIAIAPNGFYGSFAIKDGFQFAVKSENEERLVNSSSLESLNQR